MSELLTVKDICRTFQHGGETLYVLKDLNLVLDKGEFVSIVGASGAGKSTLLHLIGSLDRPTSGDLRLDGQHYSKMRFEELAELRNNKLGFVFQFHHLLPEFTALENVMMPGLIQGVRKKTASARAEQLLVDFEMKDRLTHKPSELSGGEQQRVAVARALFNDPVLLLMDEPTGNLDRIKGDRLFALIQNLQKNTGVSAIMVTHNQTLADRTDRTYILRDGRLH